MKIQISNSTNNVQYYPLYTRVYVCTTVVKLECLTLIAVKICLQLKGIELKGDVKLT